MFKIKPNTLCALAVLCTFMIISACKGCKKEAHKVKIPDAPAEISLMRFEHDLLSIDTLHPQEGLQKLHNTYGEFYISFARDILGIHEDPSDPLFIHPLSKIIKHIPFHYLLRTIDSTFGDLADLKAKLGLGMAIYKQEFPAARIPRFITFFSEYTIANASYDTILAIGLDMYMNETQSSLYRYFEFPEFRIRKLRKEYIAPNTIRALAINRYEEQTAKDKRFIANMIFEGKTYYFTRMLLPDVHDTLILGYTAQQLQWCKDNRTEIWAHFIEKDLLYKDEPSTFMR